MHETQPEVKQQQTKLSKQCSSSRVQRKSFLQLAINFGQAEANIY